MTYIQIVDWHPVREARILGFCLEMMNKTTRNTKAKFSALHPIPPHTKCLRALLQQLSLLCTNILLLLPSLGNPALKAPSSYNTFSRLSILVKLLESFMFSLKFIPICFPFTYLSETIQFTRTYRIIKLMCSSSFLILFHQLAALDIQTPWSLAAVGSPLVVDSWYSSTLSWDNSSISWCIFQYISWISSLLPDFVVLNTPRSVRLLYFCFHSVDDPNESYDSK